MKVLIIEDEAAAVRRLQKHLSEIDPNISIIGELDSIETSIHWLKNNTLPDLIFLDIHLADGSSFEIFNHVAIHIPIIFTTAYDQYALEAFKLNAIDYILKPVKKVELEQAIGKYKKTQGTLSVDYKALAQAFQQQNYDKRFLIRFGQQMHIVEMREVAYFYTQDKITFLINKQGKRYPIEYSLEKLEEMVNPTLFFRINRQFIIHIDAIKEMYAYSKSRVKIDLNPPCSLETIVSTDRSPHFKKWLIGEE